MSVVKDILAQAAFTAAVARLTKAAKKQGMDRDEVAEVFDAVLSRHFATPQPVLPGIEKPKA